MRSKLQKFTEFANTLLPHETAYLLEIQQFDDKAKLAILQRMRQLQPGPRFHALRQTVDMQEIFQPKNLDH